MCNQTNIITRRHFTDNKINLESMSDGVKIQEPNLLTRFLDHTKFEGLNGGEKDSKFRYTTKINRTIKGKITNLQTRFLFPVKIKVEWKEK